MTNKQRKAMINKLWGDIDIARRKHEKCLKRIDMAIKRLVADCPHTEQVRHNDPSGNSDHAYECLICGKEW